MIREDNKIIGTSLVSSRRDLEIQPVICNCSYATDLFPNPFDNKKVRLSWKCRWRGETQRGLRVKKRLFVTFCLPKQQCSKFAQTAARTRTPVQFFFGGNKTKKLWCPMPVPIHQVDQLTSFAVWPAMYVISLTPTSYQTSTL